MKTRRLLTVVAALTMAVCSLWARDDEVIVTRQLTHSQRNALPEKTISVEMKRLTPTKKADAALLDAITQVMDTIASEDYLNRTFVLLLEPKADGSITIAARNDDIVTRGRHDNGLYYGDLEHGRYHFVVLMDKDNQALIEQTFKRQGKVKFVLEFEFVDFKRPLYPTIVTGQWTTGRPLRWLTVVINEDPEEYNRSIDTPAHLQE